MTPFKPAQVPEEQIRKSMEDFMAAWWAGNPETRAFTKDCKTEAEVLAYVERVHVDLRAQQIYLNDTYQVNIRDASVFVEDWPAMTHLSIKRIDKQPVHDWRDFQTIKNELCGPECEAVELFPAESRLVDTANQYHLWVLNDPAAKFPFGFVERVVTNSTFGNAVQRPIEK